MLSTASQEIQLRLFAVVRGRRPIHYSLSGCSAEKYCNTLNEICSPLEARAELVPLVATVRIPEVRGAEQ